MPKRRSEPLAFADLFAVRNGRAPEDHEWPTPAKFAKGSYEWLPPELALLASLVGQISKVEIAGVLTERLRRVTGDATAHRSEVSVQNQITAIGLQTSDVVGGLTVSEAAREVRSAALVRHAIATGALASRRVGRLLVIPHDSWAKWKKQRVLPPEGYVQLSSLREQLGIASDKLSEFARAGFIETAVRCTPFGGSGGSTKFGTWFVSPSVAAGLLESRRRGLPMPWHGKPIADNLKATYKRWVARAHPSSCETCKGIWGQEGAPRSFDDYAQRYPSLAHGAKRHLTRPWMPGTSMQEVAQRSGRSVSLVRRAIEAGVLESIEIDGKRCVTKTAAARWIARKCPSGDSPKSWLSLESASKLYLFSVAELKALIDSKQLQSKVCEAGPGRGRPYVLKHQCALLRGSIGFTREEAARRLGLTLERFDRLLTDANWRADTSIPLATLQTVKKRLQQKAVWSMGEAAERLGRSIQWVRARVDAGEIVVRRDVSDARKLVMSGVMLDRLAVLSEAGRGRRRLGADWLRLGDAAVEAGVSVATLNAWSLAGLLKKEMATNGWRYHRASVRRQAAIYWRTARHRRLRPPSWLAAGALQESVCEGGVSV